MTVDPGVVLEVGPDQMRTTVRSGARSDEHAHEPNSPVNGMPGEDVAVSLPPKLLDTSSLGGE